MPNNSYLRSTRRERELVNHFRSLGYAACRSAGSHSPWDVWAWHKERKSLVLIQVKTTKGGKDLVVTAETFKDVIVEEKLYKWIKKKSLRRRKPR